MAYTLYWHLSTVTTEKSNGFPPPYLHNLIALAGIAVSHDENNPTVQNVWASMGSTEKLLGRFDGAVGEAAEIVGMFSNIFGLPVVYANSIKTGYTDSTAISNIYGGMVDNVDLAEDFKKLVFPRESTLYDSKKPLSFDRICDLTKLPLRKPLDVAAAYNSSDAKVRSRIPRVLLMDCCLIACADLRLRKILGVYDKNYCDAAEAVIIEAAGKKVPVIKKAFSAV